VVNFPRAFGTHGYFSYKNLPLSPWKRLFRSILARHYKQVRTPGTSGSERERRFNPNGSRSFPALLAFLLVGATARPTLQELS
jgi:hypothetical protein